MKIKYVILILLSIICEIGNSQNWKESVFFSSSDDISVEYIRRDNQGNFFITGILEGTYSDKDTTIDANSIDIFLAKFDSNLDKQWFKIIGGNHYDFDPVLTVDENNNIYILGTFVQTCKFTDNDSLIADFIDVFLVKYTSNGNYEWSKHLGSNSDRQYAQSIDIDQNGDIVGTFRYRNSATIIDTTVTGRTGVYNNVLFKIGSDGAIKQIENIISSSTSLFTSIKAFSDGYYIDGQFQDSLYLDLKTIASYQGTKDVFLYKTDFDFNGQWVRRTYGNSDDFTGTIAQDNYGNIYFTGYFQSDTLEIDSTNLSKANNFAINKGNSDIYISKINKSGNLIWLKNFGGKGDDWARSIKQKNDYLYLSGYFSDTLNYGTGELVSSDINDLDFFMGYLDLNGNTLGGVELETSGILDNDSGTDLLINDDNSVIVGGYFKSENIVIGDSAYNNSNNGFKESFIAKYIPPLTAIYSNQTKPTCNGQTDGELIVTPHFGVKPYTYSWSHNGGLTDSTATGLSSGTYIVTVTDAVDSTIIISYDLTEPDIITFNPVITDVSTCSYSQEGNIDLNTNGGNGGYSYSWQAAEGYGISLNAEDQSGLTIGTYNVSITDSKGCTNDTTIYITGPDPVTFNGSVVTDSSGIGPGSIDLVYSGGFGDPAFYTFDWQGPSGGLTHSEDTSNLSPGKYKVTVIDVHLCEFDTTFNVLNLDTFYIYISDYNDACNGGVNGTATVSYFSPDSHTAITYLWDANAGGQTTAQATGLASGRYYHVTVTDTENSPNTVLVDSVYIDDLSYTFAGSLAGTTTLDCFGDTDGYIDLSITSSGKLPYSYNWSTGSSLQDLTNLSVGIYSVTVTDKNNCSFLITNYTIDQPTIVSATAEIVSSPTCNGDYDGEVTVDRSGGTSPYTYQWDDPGFQDTRNADGLDAGYYNVTVTDANGCEAGSGVNLTEPDPLGVVKNIINEVCNSAGEGSVTLTVSGGTSPYTYLWTTSNGSGLVPTDKNQTGLTAGMYYFTVTDNNSCSYEDSAEITEPTLLEITNEVKTDITGCYGDLDGEITITASGGTGILTYTLSPGTIQNNTGIFSGLGAGTYSVYVEDENGCNVTSSSIEITQPAQLVITDNSVNNVTCYGVDNGSVTITVTGGTIATSYTYSWTTSDGSGLVAGVEDQPTLGAGTYYLTVSDDNSCEATSNYTLTEPTEIAVSKVKSDLLCNGDADGGVNLTVSGGVSPYSYNWTTLTGSGLVTTDKNQNGLTAGKYYFTVTDDNSCSYLDSVEITEPTVIEITSEIASDVSTCYGENTGSIDVTASGGTGLLTYTLNPGAQTNSTGSFTGLYSNNYTISIEDENNCTISSSVLTVSQPTELLLTENEVNDATCHGINNGNIDINVSGGTIATDYTYTWTTSDGSGLVAGVQDQPNVGDGTYFVTVSDDNSCEKSLNFTLTEPDTIVVTKTVSDPSCNNSSDGVIVINHTGGVLPFSYFWTTSDGSGLQPVNKNQGGLNKGTYVLEITDALGCIVENATTLTAPDEITIDTENTTDASAQDVADGSVTVTASGGTGQLTYVLSPGNVTNQTGNFNNILPGNYTVEVDDENSCGPVASNSITVGYPNAVDDIIMNEFVKIYPNPTSSKLYIELDYNADLNVEILSVSGELIQTKKIKPKGFIKEEFDLSIYSKGIYFIRIFNNEFIYTDKIILQ